MNIETQKPSGRQPGGDPDIRQNGKLTRAYRKWSSMLQRCENPNHPAFGYYGGSGVKVCERWHVFKNFLADMGHPPEGLWLERKDNAIGYEPGNCRWATPKEQAANRRKGGAPIKPDSIRQKAIRAGLPYSVVYNRILWGWTEQRALTTPVAKRSRMVKASPPIAAPARTAPDHAMALKGLAPESTIRLLLSAPISSP